MMESKVETVPGRATYWIIAYNQREYIEQCLESAISQDYHDLEILFTDDQSTDGTYEFAVKYLQNYKGPHKVRFARTEKNMGAIPHTNAVIPYISGEFVIAVCGDDFHTPNRASRVMEARRATGADVINSNFGMTDADGKLICLGREEGRTFDTGIIAFAREGINVCCYGASMNFSKEMFLRHGPIDTRYSPVNGDNIVATWGLISGGCHYIPEVLSFHRRHNNTLTRQILNYADQQNYDESSMSHYISQSFYSLKTFKDFRAAGGSVPHLDEAIAIHEKRVWQDLERWILKRNEIFNGGRRSHWIDKAAFT